MVHEKRGCTIYRKLDCEFPKLLSCCARGKLLKFNGTLQPKGCPLTATALLIFGADHLAGTIRLRGDSQRNRPGQAAGPSHESI
jgi:hypothetical protein